MHEDNTDDVHHENNSVWEAVKANKLEACKILLFTSPYYLDIGSDVSLAVRYFQEGHYYWAAFTTAFIVLPWIVTLLILPRSSPVILERQNISSSRFLCFRLYGYHDELGRQRLAAAFFVTPLYFKLNALKAKSKQGNSQKALDLKMVWVGALLVELVLESFMQSALQLYIVSKTNKVDTLLLLSILSSFFSLATGMVQVVIELGINELDQDRYTTSFLREVLCFLLFFPWLFLAFTTLLPPAAFLAALDGHAGKGWIFFIVIYIIASMVSPIVMLNWYTGKHLRKGRKYKLFMRKHVLY